MNSPLIPITRPLPCRQAGTTHNPSAQRKHRTILHSNTAQTALELAIFGTILVAVIGILINYALRFNFNQRLQMIAFREALRLSHSNDSEDKFPNVGRNSAYVIIFEDRNNPDLSSPWGIMQRSPVAGSSVASFTRHLNVMPEYGNEEDLPLVDFIVNGRRFSFTTAGFREVTCRHDPCPGSNHMRIAKHYPRGARSATKNKTFDGCYKNYVYAPLAGIYWEKCSINFDCDPENWDPLWESPSSLYVRTMAPPVNVDVDCDNKLEVILSTRGWNNCGDNCKYHAKEWALNGCANCSGVCLCECVCFRTAYRDEWSECTGSGNLELRTAACQKKVAECLSACRGSSSLEGEPQQQGLKFQIMDYQTGEINLSQDSFDLTQLGAVKQGLSREEAAEYKVEPGTQRVKLEDPDKIINITTIKQEDIITRIIQLNPANADWENVIAHTDYRNTVDNCLTTNKDKTCFDLETKKFYIRSKLRREKTERWESLKKSRYNCSGLICVYDPNGPYTTSNCDGLCMP